MEQLINLISFIITFFLGFFIGQGKITKETITQVITQTKKKLDTSPVGVIRTPTARDQYLKEHPLEKEGMAEMAKDLEKIGIPKND